MTTNNELRELDCRMAPANHLSVDDYYAVEEFLARIESEVPT